MDIPQSLAAGVTDELTRFPTIGLGSSTGVLWQVSKWWEHMTSHGGIGLSVLLITKRWFITDSTV
jgi:hypothetical protein